MWTCKRYAALLAPYSESALPADEAARVKAHVETCPACRDELATLVEVSHLLRAHRPAAPEPAADLWGRIQTRIAPAPRPVPVRAARWRAGLALPAAGLAATALILGALFRPVTEPAPSKPPEAGAPAPSPAKTRVVKLDDPAARENRTPPGAMMAKGTAPPRPVTPQRKAVRPRPVAVAAARPNRSALGGVAKGAPATVPPAARTRMADNKLADNLAFASAIINNNVVDDHFGTTRREREDAPGVGSSGKRAGARVADKPEPGMTVAPPAPADPAPAEPGGTEPEGQGDVSVASSRPVVVAWDGEQGREPEPGKIAAPGSIRPQSVAFARYVPATASAHEEALSIQRQRNLFRYSRR